MNNILYNFDVQFGSGPGAELLVKSPNHPPTKIYTISNMVFILNH